MPSPSRDLRQETTAAIAAVTEALGLAAGGVRDEDIAFKGRRDVVTTVDVAAEDAVRRRLADGPGLPVVGEERGGEVPADGSAHWLVDPICGTRNFASGVPLYCVNLALVEGGKVTVAVVGDPSRHEVLVAERDHGAWVLPEAAAARLATTGQAEPADLVDLVAADRTETLIVEDGSCRGERRELAAAFNDRLIRADRWDRRSLGSTLSLPYVAAGRASAYVVFRLPPLHCAAGALLAAQAGATVSDLDGRPWTVAADSIVAAATPRLHDDLLGLLGAARAES